MTGKRKWTRDGGNLHPRRDAAEKAPASAWGEREIGTCELARLNIESGTIGLIESNYWEVTTGCRCASGTSRQRYVVRRHWEKREKEKKLQRACAARS